MIDVLAPIIGEQAARIVILAAILLLIAALALVVVGLAFRIFRGRSFGFRGSRNRAPRLSVPDVLPIDSRRKLVLVRRDAVEHLLLVGGATDVVIETAIQRAVQQGNRRPVTAAPAAGASAPGAAPGAPAATTAAGRPPAARPAAPVQPAAAQRPPAARPAAPVAPTAPARPQPAPPSAAVAAPAAPPPAPAPATPPPSRMTPPSAGSTRLPTPAGRANFPMPPPAAPAAAAAAATIVATTPVVAGPPPSAPLTEAVVAIAEEMAESAETEAMLESSRVALAEAIERDFESMVPAEVEPAAGAAPDTSSSETPEKPATESVAESAERLSNRENEMAALLGEIFGKK